MLVPNSTRGLVSIVFHVDVVEQFDVSGIVLDRKLPELDGHVLDFRVHHVHVGNFEGIERRSIANLSFDVSIQSHQIVGFGPRFFNYRDLVFQ